MKNLRYLSLIGILIFIVILTRLDTEKLIHIIINLNYFYFTISFFLFPLSYLILGLKWRIIIEAHGIRFPMRKTVIVSIIGTSVGFVTPGRLGDFFRALYLNPLGKALSTVFVDKIISVMSIFLIAIFFMPEVVTHRSETLFFVIILSILFLTLIKKGSRRTINFFSRFIPASIRDRTMKSVEDFFEGLRVAKNSKFLLILAFLLSLVQWMVGALQVYLLAFALRVYVDYFFILSMVSTGVILSLIPISILGVGTRDAVYIYFLTHLGIEAERAVSLSILTMFLYLLSIPFGLILLYFYPPEKPAKPVL